MKAFFSSLLQDNSGGFSTVRLLSLLWLIVVAGVWCWVCLKAGSMCDIPEGVRWLTGLIVGAKAVQRFGEDPA